MPYPAPSRPGPRVRRDRRRRHDVDSLHESLAYFTINLPRPITTQAPNSAIPKLTRKPLLFGLSPTYLSRNHPTHNRPHDSNNYIGHRALLRIRPHYFTTQPPRQRPDKYPNKKSVCWVHDFAPSGTARSSSHRIDFVVSRNQHCVSGAATLTPCSLASLRRARSSASPVFCCSRISSSASDNSEMVRLFATGGSRRATAARRA